MGEKLVGTSAWTSVGRVGTDLARPAVDIEGLSMGASELGARDEVPGCEIAFGDCALCPSLDGDAITGEATLTLAESCTEASTEAGWATTYEVVAFELGAQYDGS